MLQSHVTRFLLPELNAAEFWCQNKAAVSFLRVADLTRSPGSVPTSLISPLAWLGARSRPRTAPVPQGPLHQNRAWFHPSCSLSGTTWERPGRLTSSLHHTRGHFYSCSNIFTGKYKKNFTFMSTLKRPQMSQPSKSSLGVVRANQNVPLLLVE